MERVQQAAATVSPAGGGYVGRDRHLEQIDGLIYGDSPVQGFVRGRSFVHPLLRFTFTVPDGFRLRNQPTSVQALDGSRRAGILFDMDQAAYPREKARHYLLSRWAPNMAFEQVEDLDLNGYQATLGFLRTRSRSGDVAIRFLAIAGSEGRFFRFVFISPWSEDSRYSPAFKDTAYSFSELSVSEAESVEPDRVRIVTVSDGDTVAALSALMPEGPAADERFRILNGLAPGEEPAVGSPVKIVVVD